MLALQEVSLESLVADIPEGSQGVILQAPQGYYSPYIKIARKGAFYTLATCVLYDNMYVADNKIVWVVNFNDLYISDYNVCITYHRLHIKDLEFVKPDKFTIEHLLIACATFGMYVMYPSVYEGYYHLP